MGYNSIECLREILPNDLFAEVANSTNLNTLFEIRLILGARIVMKCYDGKTIMGRVASLNQINGIISKITGNSLYAYNDAILEGYLPFKGLRVGVSGVVVREKDSIIQLKEINALVIRIPHEMIGCSDLIYPGIFDGDVVLNTLIFSPPARGKTTILRDIARKLASDGRAVVVIDYKNEISASFKGVNIMDLGASISIVGSPRGWGLERAIRNLTPDVIITDEVYSEQEIACLKKAISGGVSVIATMHSGGFDSIPNFFDRYVRLELPIGTARMFRQKGTDFQEINLQKSADSKALSV